MRSIGSLTLTALIAGALAACAGPKVDIVAETAALTARADALTEAEVAKDVEKALSFYAADAIVQPANAPAISGMEAMRGLYKQFMDDPNFKSFGSTRTALVVSPSGDMGYEYGVNRMVFATPGGDMTDIGKYLGIWKKDGAEWRVVALAFSSDAPPPAMPAAPAASQSKAPSNAPAKKPM
ncbi:MAG: nuclear transport factor 2 family protein [Gemmatimonadota bacterium]|nr:nuclear transport factor 2 family protein [Gemmatimonadota bacterium]